MTSAANPAMNTDLSQTRRTGTFGPESKTIQYVRPTTTRRRDLRPYRAPGRGAVMRAPEPLRHPR